MERLVAKPIEVPTAEFLTYCLFHRKRLGTPDYQAIGRKLHVALAAIEACLDFDNHSLPRAQTHFGAEKATP